MSAPEKIHAHSDVWREANYRKYVLWDGENKGFLNDNFSDVLYIRHDIHYEAIKRNADLETENAALKERIAKIEAALCAMLPAFEAFIENCPMKGDGVFLWRKAGGKNEGITEQMVQDVIKAIKDELDPRAFYNR